MNPQSERSKLIHAYVTMDIGNYRSPLRDLDYTSLRGELARRYAIGRWYPNDTADLLEYSLMSHATDLRHETRSEYGDHMVTCLKTPAYAVGSTYAEALVECLLRRTEHLEVRERYLKELEDERNEG